MRAQAVNAHSASRLELNLLFSPIETSQDPISAFARTADSSRASRNVQIVPTSDIEPVEAKQPTRWEP